MVMFNSTSNDEYKLPVFERKDDEYYSQYKEIEEKVDQEFTDPESGFEIQDPANQSSQDLDDLDEMGKLHLKLRIYY
jgi:hypothetical protein